MSTEAIGPKGAPALRSAGDASPGDGIWSVYETELTKLRAQLPTRLLALVCVLGPFAFAGVLKAQSGTPADALFGGFVHQSGFAISLVVLGFAGSWGFPLIAGVLAGDLFAAEDRHNTWKTILTRSCSLGELFTGKLLAVLTVTGLLLLLAAVASLAAGTLLVGAHTLTGLSGQPIAPAHALLLTALAWVVCVLPLMSYVALGALFSVATRNGIVGVLGPVLVALATQLIDLIGKGTWVHLLVIGSPFLNVYGIFTAHPFFGPLAVTCGASLVWTVACLAAAWMILRRRDFVAGAATWSIRPLVPAGIVAGLAILVAGLAFAAGFGPVSVTRTRLQRSIATAFSNVSLYQQELLGRRSPPGARLDVRPYCSRRGTKSVGPGDWQCTLNIYLPQPKAIPFQRTQVEYDVSVASNGCYKAQSPPYFIGGQTMADASGHKVVNPLFTVYGCFNSL